jgi:hypothetical protein
MDCHKGKLMSDLIDLNEARRRTLRLLQYEDGLWDMMLGLTFLLLSLYPVTRRLLGPAWNLLLFLAALAALTAGLAAARAFLSAPRVGVVKMRRTPALKVALIATAALVLATLALVVATLLFGPPIPAFNWSGLPGWVGDLTVDIVVALAVVGLFSLLAYLFGVARLYAYGWLLGVGNLASTALRFYAGYTFNLPLAVAAGIILLVGATLFVRFLRKYPIPTQGAENGKA